MSLAAPVHSAHVKTLSQNRKLVSVSAISVTIIRYPSVHFWLFGIQFVFQSVKDFLNLEITAYLSAKYRVIHKSVKHFKNSKQIDYAKDHGNSYVDRERNC